MRSFLLATLAIVVASELGTVVWGSLFSYANRTLGRVVVITGLLAVYWALRGATHGDRAPPAISGDGTTLARSVGTPTAHLPR